MLYSEPTLWVVRLNPRKLPQECKTDSNGGLHAVIKTYYKHCKQPAGDF